MAPWKFCILDGNERETLISIKWSTSSSDTKMNKRKKKIVCFLFRWPLHRCSLFTSPCLAKMLSMIERDSKKNINNNNNTVLHPLQWDLNSSFYFLVPCSFVYALEFTEIEVIWIIAISLNNHALYLLFCSTLCLLTIYETWTVCNRTHVNWTYFHCSFVVFHMCRDILQLHLAWCENGRWKKKICSKADEPKPVDESSMHLTWISGR